MAVTTTTSQGITSVIFTYKAQTARVIQFVDSAAHFLADKYGDGTPYNQMTNAQKLETVDRYVFMKLHEARLGQAEREGQTAKNAVIEAARQEPPLEIKLK